MRRLSMRLALVAVLVTAGVSTGWAWASLENRPDDAELAIDLSLRLQDVTVEHAADGQYLVIAPTREGRRTLSPQEFVELLAQSQERQRLGGKLFVLLNITNWTGVLWVVFGLLGQVLFTGRMIVQWLASEKAKRSVVPRGFWWMSLIGATMLMIYFLWRKDAVGVLGQAAGWHVYLRNLVLIRREENGQAPAEAI
ncbi:MAG: lipid-A-disaccharide synthase N-terminal domain-containing protein [Phycisphaeraceae bacterium]|nr:lipid-A-disaccharide synthase N-terminal domain-containing protein [Phycisphaeraceae bacterium]